MKCAPRWLCSNPNSVQYVKIERRLIPTDVLPTCLHLYKYLSLTHGARRMITKFCLSWQTLCSFFGTIRLPNARLCWQQRLNPRNRCQTCVINLCPGGSPRFVADSGSRGQSSSQWTNAAFDIPLDGVFTNLHPPATRGSCRCYRVVAILRCEKDFQQQIKFQPWKINWVTNLPQFLLSRCLEHLMFSWFCFEEACPVLEQT